MEFPKRKPNVSPVTETPKEQLEQRVLEIELDAELADEKQVLEEMRRISDKKKGEMDVIRDRVSRITNESEPG